MQQTKVSFCLLSDKCYLEERNIEFLGEGIRNYDLMRLLQVIPAKGIAPSKSPTDAGYIWPISASELALNHLCTDN